MKNIKTILAGALMVFALASCTKNEEQTNDFKQIVNESKKEKVAIAEHLVYFQFNSDVGIEMESQLIIGTDTINVPCCTLETFADDFVANNVANKLTALGYQFDNISTAEVATINLYTNKNVSSTNYITHVVN